MSRVGKQPIKIPSGVKVLRSGSSISIDGPKGSLKHVVPAGVGLEISADTIRVVSTASKDGRSSDLRGLEVGSLVGLTRSLLHNMVVGVTTGFSRELEIVGVGYRAQSKGNVLSLTLGYSHSIEFKIPDGVQARVDGNTKIFVSGADKGLVGLVAAKIRGFKEPEPYQGKGVRYVNETIIRKQGKAAGAK